MTHTRSLLISLIVVLGAIATNQPSKAPTTNGDAGTEQNPQSGVTTLYALDPVRRTFSFRDGKFGSVVVDHRVFNRQSDIDFGGYQRGVFSVGIEGGSWGAIVDLGPSATLGDRFGIAETVGGGQAFSSIRFEGDELVIGRGTAEHNPEAFAPVAKLWAHSEAFDSASVELDHVYLVRMTRKREADFELVVKFQVIAHTPGQSTTIHWVKIKG